MKIERMTKVADSVLAQVEKIFKKKEDKDLGGSVWVEPYKNGRENGHAIIYASGLVFRKAVFAEYRNTDEIAVYVGTRDSQFSMQGNVPSDNVWKKRKMFGASQVNKAANEVMRWLLTG
jgi:hypothetical protein